MIVYNLNSTLYSFATSLVIEEGTTIFTSGDTDILRLLNYIYDLTSFYIRELNRLIKREENSIVYDNDSEYYFNNLLKKIKSGINILSTDLFSSCNGTAATSEIRTVITSSEVCNSPICLLPISLMQTITKKYKTIVLPMTSINYPPFSLTNYIFSTYALKIPLLHK